MRQSAAKRGLFAPAKREPVMGDNISCVQSALDYAAAGIPIFPCRPENKRPYTDHGFKDASTDSTLINEWWSRWPDAMIGMPTGRASGIDVLDIDNKIERIHEGAAP
jgi:Bifunctional DNA primase/polymerase, N-terminal